MTSIKDKIAAVRSVVSDRSNDEIVLVLQHHDEDVDKTIADFLDGGNANDILTEWKHAGPPSKANKAKKRKKQKKAKQAQAAKNAQNAEEINSPKLMNGHGETEDEPKSEEMVDEKTAAALKQLLTNQKADNFKENDNTNSVSANSVPVAVLNGMDNSENHSAEVAKAIKQQQYLYHGGRRSRTSSENATKKKQKHQQSNLAGNKNESIGQAYHVDGAVSANKKSIEKAVKDLNRCTVSYGRYKTLLNAEIQDSYKRIKQVFEELTNALMDREVKLIRELDEIKEAAIELMAKREAQALELKRQTDRVDSMSHQQLNDLRSEIKHFVAERKFDEELGRTSRFVFDREILTQVIPSIGEITGIKNSYTPRNRTESAASYTSDAGGSNTVQAGAPTKEPESVPTKLTHATAPGKVSAPYKPYQPSTSAKSNASQTPPNKLPIADPIQPANSSQTKTKQPSSSTTAPAKAKEVTNGHVEDWAAEASDLPLPESPASWASATPIMTPDGTFKDGGMSNPQPQRTPRRDRQQKSSISEKDKDLMPPPNKIPQSKSTAPKLPDPKRERSADGPRNNTGDSNQRNFKSVDYKASGDRPPYRGGPRGRGRGGFYRGNRGGPMRGSYPRGGYQGNNDYGPRPNSGPYRNDRGGRQQRGQYGGPNRRYNDADGYNQKYSKGEGPGSGPKSAVVGDKKSAAPKDSTAPKSN